MKKAILCLIWLISSIIYAQEFMYVHTATSDNSIASLTRLDHPMLNDNPNAKIVVTHNYEPNDVYNDHVTGVFYNTATGVWFLRNEDLTPMVENASFNIYIAQEDEIFVHESTPANQGSGPNITLIDHPLLNDNFGRLVLATNFFNPNEVTHDNNYGIFYSNVANRRGIFTEGGQIIPEDAAFFVYVSGVNTNVVTYRHQANADNIALNYTLIDYAPLNNNPDAIFVASHYFGPLPNSNVNNDSTIGVWYSTFHNKWSVYNEDLTGMPEGIVFDLIIFDPSLSVNEEALQQISVSPNPSSELAHITLPQSVGLQTVQIFDVTGKLMDTLHFDASFGSRIPIPLSSYASGVYFFTLTTDRGAITKKVIKN